MSAISFLLFKSVFCLRVTAVQTQQASFKGWTWGKELKVAGCRLQVEGCRLQVAGCRLKVAG
jgi:hypothetical protein